MFGVFTSYQCELFLISSFNILCTMLVKSVYIIYFMQKYFLLSSELDKNIIFSATDY